MLHVRVYLCGNVCKIVRVLHNFNRFHRSFRVVSIDFLPLVMSRWLMWSTDFFYHTLCSLCFASHWWMKQASPRRWTNLIFVSCTPYCALRSLSASFVSIRSPSRLLIDALCFCYTYCALQCARVSCECSILVHQKLSTKLLANLFRCLTRHFPAFQVRFVIYWLFQAAALAFFLTLHCLPIIKANQNTRARVCMCIECSVPNELLRVFGTFHTALKCSAGNRKCIFIASTKCSTVLLFLLALFTDQRKKTTSKSAE